MGPSWQQSLLRMQTMETIPTSFTTYRVEIQEVSTELTPFSYKNITMFFCYTSNTVNYYNIWLMGLIYWQQKVFSILYSEQQPFASLCR